MRRARSSGGSCTSAWHLPGPSPARIDPPDQFIGLRPTACEVGEKRLDPAGNRDDKGYTGDVSDSATGLVYMQARYMAPVTGRLLTTDPIGYQDQLNLYAYVHTDPVTATDPTGEFANVLAGAAIGAVVGAVISGGAEIVNQMSKGEDINFAKADVAAAATVGVSSGAMTLGGTSTGQLGKPAVEIGLDVAKDTALGTLISQGVKASLWGR